MKIKLFFRLTYIFYPASYFIVNVDEFLQEAETLSVHDMPRSASSLSVRTDASGAAVIIKIHNVQLVEFFPMIDIFCTCNCVKIPSIYFLIL